MGNGAPYLRAEEGSYCICPKLPGDRGSHSESPLCPDALPTLRSLGPPFWLCVTEAPVREVSG